MNKYKINIFSYFSTILWALLAAGIFSGCLIYYAQYDVINNSSSKYNEKVLNEYIKNTVIEQNINLEMNYPDDYRIDMHLGYLYNIIKEYDKAEYYYKKAVAKAPLNIYRPLYELASFYIERLRFEEAQQIIDEFPQIANSALIKYQSFLYRKKGDAYYNNQKYYFALKEYEKSRYYWVKLSKPSLKYLYSLNKKLSETAVILADIAVNSNRAEEAVQFLKIAEKVTPKDFIVRYKLALMTANTDPELSCKYFDKLFKEYPTQVDYAAYYNSLIKLVNLCENQGNYNKAKLYDFRAKALLDYVYINIISKQDIDFKVTDKTLYKIGNKYKIILKFNIQNISKMSIKNMKMDIVYKLGNHTIETYTKTLIEPTNRLLPDDSINDIRIIPKNLRKYKQTDIPQISAEIYLYKIPSKKLCVYKEKLFDANTKIKQSKLNLDCQSYIEFFAHQILNIGSSINSYKDSR